MIRDINDSVHAMKISLLNTNKYHVDISDWMITPKPTAKYPERITLNIKLTITPKNDQEPMNEKVLQETTRKESTPTNFDKGN